MSIYEDIRARIQSDKERAASWPNDESLEGARAAVVGEILKIAEYWRDKAESYGPEEAYTALRAIIADQVLEALNEGLWDE